MLPPSSSPYFFTTPTGKASGVTFCWKESKRRRGALKSMRGLLPDQLEDLALDLLSGPLRHLPLGGGAAADVDRLAVAVAVEDARVDVGAAADRRGVAERRRHRLHRAGDGAFR